MTNTNIPWDPYWDPNGNGWRANAVDNFARDHQIDPETGLLSGPTALPPHQLARQYQALHNQAIWQRQQRYMDDAQRQLADATRFQQGALGLLSSYRAGGATALQSGIYNQVAGGMRSQAAGSFQRAQMTQPLDYQSDLRRHEGAEAARRAERASERAMYTNLGVALINNVSSAITSGGGSGGGSGGSGGLTIAQSAFDGGGTVEGGAQAVSGGAGSEVAGSATAAQGAQIQSSEPVSLEPEQAVPSGPNPLQSGGVQAGQQQQQQGSPFQGAESPQANYDPFSQSASPVGVGAGAGGGGQQMQQASPMAGAGAGVGAPVTMGGMDGNFSHDMLAAATVMQDPTIAPVAQMALNDYVAHMYENDPFYQSLPMAIQARWEQRLAVAS